MKRWLPQVKTSFRLQELVWILIDFLFVQHHFLPFPQQSSLSVFDAPIQLTRRLSFLALHCSFPAPDNLIFSFFLSFGRALMVVGVALGIMRTILLVDRHVGSALATVFLPRLRGVQRAQWEWTVATSRIALPTLRPQWLSSMFLPTPPLQ